MPRRSRGLGRFAQRHAKKPRRGGRIPRSTLTTSAERGSDAAVAVVALRHSAHSVTACLEARRLCSLTQSPQRTSAARAARAYATASRSAHLGRWSTLRSRTDLPPYISNRTTIVANARIAHRCHRPDIRRAHVARQHTTQMASTSLTLLKSGEGSFSDVSGVARPASLRPRSAHLNLSAGDVPEDFVTVSVARKMRKQVVCPLHGPIAVALLDRPHERDTRATRTPTH